MGAVPHPTEIDFGKTKNESWCRMEKDVIQRLRTYGLPLICCRVSAKGGPSIRREVTEGGTERERERERESLESRFVSLVPVG